MLFSYCFPFDLVCIEVNYVFDVFVFHNVLQNPFSTHVPVVSPFASTSLHYSMLGPDVGKDPHASCIGAIARARVDCDHYLPQHGVRWLYSDEYSH
jgi:hypothetical protein